MEERKNGIMEYWNDGIMGRKNTNKEDGGVYPIFHHSIIPSFFFEVELCL